MSSHSRNRALGVLGLAALSACGGTSPTTSNPPVAVPASASEPHWVSQLDATVGQLPEGLALSRDGHTAYVGLAPTGEILAIDTDSGATRSFGRVPPPPANAGFLLGLNLNETGELFAGVASFSPEYQAGIYRLAAGEEARLFASHPELTFPNALVFAEDGMLYASDSLSGTIFRIERSGDVSKWLSDPRLLGDRNAACAGGAPFPIGANGMVLIEDVMYVVNSDHGSVLRIELAADGSPRGISTLIASDCETLGGADGITASADGALLIAANMRNAITRVDLDGDVRVLLSGGALDFPASLALHVGATGARLFVTNFALNTAQTPGVQAQPGLLMLPLDGYDPG